MRLSFMGPPSLSKSMSPIVQVQQSMPLRHHGQIRRRLIDEAHPPAGSPHGKKRKFHGQVIALYHRPGLRRRFDEAVVVLKRGIVVKQRGLVQVAAQQDRAGDGKRPPEAVHPHQLAQYEGDGNDAAEAVKHADEHGKYLPHIHRYIDYFLKLNINNIHC